MHRATIIVNSLASYFLVLRCHAASGLGAEACHLDGGAGRGWRQYPPDSCPARQGGARDAGGHPHPSGPPGIPCGAPAPHYGRQLCVAAAWQRDAASQPRAWPACDGGEVCIPAGAGRAGAHARRPLARGPPPPRLAPGSLLCGAPQAKHQRPCLSQAMLSRHKICKNSYSELIVCRMMLITWAQ
eukprot:scaffold152405_cov55-Prasinocladus_malaysianus.AAC.1